jgi:hypothetical protein
LFLREQDIEIWVAKLRCNLGGRGSQLVSPLMKALVEQEFAYVLRGATYYASSSFRSTCVTHIEYLAHFFALSL